MFLLSILRPRASCRRFPLPISLSTRHVIPRLPAQLRSPIQPSFSKRLISNDAAKARAPLSYPAKINIYRAGTPITLFVGMLRVATLVLFGLGTFILAPTFLFSPDHSALWVPCLIVGSAVPMAVVILATGPVVHQIQLQLPAAVRKSKSELKRFADSTPGDAVLRLHYMRLAPWFTIQEVPFNRLRRFDLSLRSGLANLEYVPEHVEKHKGTIWFWLAQSYFGKYYVKRDQTVDRAAVPGVWDKMWPQIPMKGSKDDPLIRKLVKGSGERKAVRMSGRPGSVSGRDDANRKAVVPPPPPPGSRRKI